MKNTLLKLVLPLFLLVVLAAAGCEGEISFTTADLSEATMATGVDADSKPVGATDVFSTDAEEIFCSVKLSNAPSDTEINSVWTYVSGEVEDLENYEIDAYALTADGTRYLNFSMTRPDNGFPRGEYRLDLYIDGEEAESLTFTVE